MKRITTLAAVLMLFAFANGVYAESAVLTKGNLDREAAKKAFAQLTKNAQKGLLAPNAVVKSKFAAIDPVNVSLADGSGAVEGCLNGMRLWFELSDGKLVNPKTYRFTPNEIFYVHVESAVPVYVTLYQNFPDEKESVQAYPVERFPSSFRILEPGKGTKLPVTFKMDGNFKDEFMSIVVARADWDGIVEDIPDSAAIAAAIAQAETPQEVTAVYRGVVKGRADISSKKVLTKFAAINDLGLEGFNNTNTTEIPKPEDENAGNEAPKPENENTGNAVPMPEGENAGNEAPKPEDENAGNEAPKPEDENAGNEAPKPEDENAGNEAPMPEDDKNKHEVAVYDYDLEGTIYSVSFQTYIEPTTYKPVSALSVSVAVDEKTDPGLMKERGTYQNIDDVAIYLFSNNGIGQLHIVLQKVDPDKE